MAASRLDETPPDTPASRTVAHFRGRGRLWKLVDAADAFPTSGEPKPYVGALEQKGLNFAFCGGDPSRYKPLGLLPLTCPRRDLEQQARTRILAQQYGNGIGLGFYHSTSGFYSAVVSRHPSEALDSLVPCE